MRIILLNVLCISAVALPALGQPEETTAATAPELEPRPDREDWFEPPTDAALCAKLEDVISRLGSPSYGERESATAEAIEMGPQTFGALRAVYQETDDLEVRLRIERIVREAYLKYHVFDRNAFLGIRQSLAPVVHAEEPRIAESHIGIKIADALKDTAAERVGLKANDVIIALDGKPLSGAGREAVIDFGESIRVRGPGTTVTLTVLRGPEKFDVDVVLGARPKAYYGGGQGQVFEMLNDARHRFDAFWSEHFAAPPQGNSG